MRHILILDVRSKEEYDKAHIRDSIHISIPEFDKAKLVSLIDDTAKENATSNPKPADTLRRLLLVTSGPLNASDPAIKSLIGLINSSRTVTQLIQLKGGIEPLKAKYPYLIVHKDSTKPECGIAASRFPSVVSEGKLYLGNFLNACATKQLDLMGINTLIGITPMAMTGVPPRFKYVHFPFMENNQDRQVFLFDFEGVVNAITESIAKGEKIMVFSMV